VQDNLKSIHPGPLRMLRVLHFNPNLDSYTLSFFTPGAKKKTEQLMTTTQIMNLPGGPEAIQNYKTLTKEKLPLKTQPRIICAFNFNSNLDNYMVKIQNPGETSIIETLMTTAEILNLPSGASAIASYNRLSHLQPINAQVVIPVIGHLSSAKKSKLRAFNFNPDLDSYTLSFYEAGKKLEKLMTTAHILDLPGGYEAIEKYKKLELERYNTTQPKIICAFNFNLALDNYTVKIQNPGETTLIEKQMTTTEILYLPNGASAIASYNRLSHLAPMNAQALAPVQARNLSILKFDNVMKIYTVSYTDPGKRARDKKTEQIVTRSELTKMHGTLL
jgi:hypothetical protein